ncbi:MaoC family dehydratase [Sphingomonas sp. BN140010]|uniref:MaoC family dehydratase n=1 Tax=Sphingomonas arvum TaxID=2992113 RepID=A0ABT3JDH8_9SPHN|nr:MaoC family dehydratase [Sphingomonas sp. BN140010]MCW3797138.1 MaoC family dehydratase [Sphingomonas sp. BN140010]
MIYFEDLPLGEERTYGSVTVTRDEVIDFARKYDPQPFHLSDEAAARTHFGRLAASGWHTCALAMGVIARAVVHEEQAGLGSPGLDELRWLKPVYPGDTLTVRSTILDKTPSRSKPDLGSFRTRTRVTNQGGVDVLTFTSIVLIRRRPRI